MKPNQSEDTKKGLILKPPALPTGEHPWAARLRRQRKLVSRAQLVLSLALTLLLGLSGLATHLSDATLQQFHSPFLSGLVFAAVLLITYGLVGFPLSFVSGYIIEKRFGLSTQNIKGWLTDQLKGALLGVVLGSVIILGLIAALIWGQSSWWWICALGSALFGVLLTRLAPQLILPLFFKLKPVDSPELQSRFLKLAETTGTPVLGIYEIDLSRRTRAANAAVIGFGDSRKAVVGDTLLAEFSTDEVEFVLAHELAHHRYHDLWLGIGISSILTTVALGLTETLLHPTDGNFSPITLFWIAITVSFIGSVLNPLSKFFSRFAETRADRFAAASTHNAVAGANAFRKLGYQNIAVFRPPVWEEKLFYTHPAIARRISRLEQSAH